MTEFNNDTHQPETSLEYSAVREKISLIIDDIVTYDPSGNSMPQMDRGITELVLGSDSVPLDILTDYVTIVKFEADAIAEYGSRKPNYWDKLEKISAFEADDLRALYGIDGHANPLRTMLTHQVSDKENGPLFIRPAFDILKKIYAVESVPTLTHSNPEDETLLVLTESMRSGDRKIYDVYQADDPRNKLKAGSQELRVWMRDAIMMSTGLDNPNQADAYIYSSSRSLFGPYGLDIIADRIKSYGSVKLKAIQEFANISALSSYSDEQLDRMYKLSQGDTNEIERLASHDVIVTLINMDGDHNGVSSGVAERLDDESERTLFFEITNPHQVYSHLKKLHNLGILPTTLIFASHGGAGQFAIGERPPLNSDKATTHFTVVMDQDLTDSLIAKAGDDTLIGHDVSTANGLVRSIQRFMQPSRGIDDPEQDLGRKKIISLSCEFDGDTRRASLASNGERVDGEKTTLLRRLGEVIVHKLTNEHIDIYGSTISTNQQTATDKGFHYNQIRDGRWAPYPASVLHIDGQDMQWHRLNEVQLRNDSINKNI